MTLPNLTGEDLLKQKFEEDEAEANGSSIALLMSMQENRFCLLVMLFLSVALQSLNRISSGKIKMDLFKLSHDGSKENTSPALIEKLECKNYLFSTNGAKLWTS